MGEDDITRPYPAIAQSTCKLGGNMRNFGEGPFIPRTIVGQRNEPPAIPRKLSKDV